MTMSIEKYDVQPLFATPYFRADMHSAITPEQVSFIKNRNYSRIDKYPT